MKLFCQVCETPISAPKRKYCSKRCKYRSHNIRHNQYAAQQLRGAKRKAKLVKMHGGKCTMCGYRSSLSVLCFHHKDPASKKFQLDIRNCSNRTWEKLANEASKCQLLCANCHGEVHNADGKWDKLHLDLASN